ncbi:MAG: methyl-accepting chemotaxis protein [Phenylobacterium sp.]|uniref:methyl-accepting chemotaxis protein n=1 Tax=Phenylobacterium sp. TaxID=1871053 RepID=UPI00271A0E72|nr:methyl-accepting chemotaxis protein [Phenylobacterium sp.]MDO9433581.1 methyl-accepting chemotaxis protein [Phenylobacterium sp.]
MLFDNLKISRKLALGFTAVTLTMAGMGGAMLVNLRALDEARIEIKESRETLTALSEAKFYLTRQENSYRGYLLSKNDYYLERVDKHRANFKQRLDAAREQLIDSPELAAKVDLAGKGADKWRSDVVDAGVRLSADPITLPDALAMVGPDGLADQLISPVEDAMDAVVQSEMAKMDELQQVQINSTRNAYASLVIGLALAVMFAIGLGLLLTRMIAGPVNAMTAAMRRLAQGDFTAAIPAMGRKDEVGQMAEAVSVFKEAGIEKLRLEKQASEQAAAVEAERARNEAGRAAAAQEQADVVLGLAEGLERLSQGDLTHRITRTFPADYVKLQTDFNAAMGQLQDAMTVVVSNVSGIRNGAGEISTAADDLSRRTEQQAASLEETAAALDEITATVNKTASGAKTCAQVVLAARGDAQKSGEVVRQAVAAMSEIEQSAQQISQIIGVIDEIAFQTNLLALNAGVEAARAGEAGRGFAVVASEVRALAQRSAEAAKEIKTLISSSTQQVGQGVHLVGETGDALQRIVGRVAEIDSLVGEIAASALEQATGLAEVNGAVNQMDQVTQQNAAMVEESTAASHALANEAEALAGSVARFKIGHMQAVSSGRRPAAPAAQMKRSSRDGSALRKSEPETDGWEEF